jgi:tRNA threonylcarbamoyladenosine biosynthesis protein TsaE
MVVDVDTVTSEGPADTEALGRAWGGEVDPGWVILLYGELGAGKTVLVRGLARGLGSPARVHSPTFNLLHVYRGGRLPLFHLDLYRLDGPEAVVNAGLEEYLVNEGVTVIEWPERLVGTAPWPAWAPLPRRLRRVHLEILGPNRRRIVYEDVGLGLLG